MVNKPTIITETCPPSKLNFGLQYQKVPLSVLHFQHILLFNNFILWSLNNV